MVILYWLFLLSSAFLNCQCMSVSNLESTMIKVLGDPYADCTEVKQCTNCKGTGLVNSFRTFDGTCNHLDHPLNGAAMVTHQRFLHPEYAKDTTGFPRGFPNMSPKDLPSGHMIAQNVFTSVNEIEGNKFPTSLLFMIFGQFIDHDITQVSHAKTKEKCPSVLSCNDATFERDFKYPCNPIRMHDGSGCTKLTRTKPACQTNSNKTSNAMREQVNMITSYVDGSAIYGSSDEQALNLRALDGTGKLRMGDKDLLPIDLDLDEMCNEKGMSGCFAAGDTRSSEHIGLAAFHTLWAREHNRIAKKLKEINPFWSGSMTYYTARRIVIAEIQHILYQEWLPKIVTMDPTYEGFEPAYNNPTIANAFAHAAYRFGHTLVPNSLPQLDKDFNYVRPNIGLREAFFNMKPIMQKGIDNTILGMVANESETVDGRFADAIARHLFTNLSDSTLEDLTAINIHRGRDHGLPPYYKWRKMCTNESFESNWESLKGIIKEPAIKNLKKVYKSVEDIDLFVGGILEIPVSGKMLGETFGCIIKKQFEKLRRGDRYYYENKNVFTHRQFLSIQKVTMRQVLCDNLDDVTSLHDDVFLAYKAHRRRTTCIKAKSIGDIHPSLLDINLWADKGFPTKKT